MFRVGQIISPTKLLKNFSKIASHITNYPQALLITQRSGKHLVLMDAELYDQLVERAMNDRIEIPPETGL